MELIRPARRRRSPRFYTSSSNGLPSSFTSSSSTAFLHPPAHSVGERTKVHWKEKEGAVGRTSGVQRTEEGLSSSPSLPNQTTNEPSSSLTSHLCASCAT